jgi:hypothetical protein
MPKLSQAATQTLPMPATKVPTKIANKVIVFPGVLATPKQTAPKGGFCILKIRPRHCA